MHAFCLDQQIPPQRLEERAPLLISQAGSQHTDVLDKQESRYATRWKRERHLAHRIVIQGDEKHYMKPKHADRRHLLDETTSINLARAYEINSKLQTKRRIVGERNVSLTKEELSRIFAPVMTKSDLNLLNDTLSAFAKACAIHRVSRLFSCFVFELT